MSFTEIRSESFFLREVQTWIQKEDVRFTHVVEYTELHDSALEADLATAVFVSPMSIN